MVNITITAPNYTSAVNDSKTLFNSEKLNEVYLLADSSSYSFEITKQPSHGSATLFSVGNEIINYSYDPDDSYVGSDFFEYKLTHTIDGCSYESIGRVDLTVKEYVAPKKLIAMCKLPYSVGTELYITEGNEDSTVLVKDLAPGRINGINGGKAVDSNPRMLNDITKVGDIQYFVARYSAGGSIAEELYKSDGTSAGTVVHDLNPNNAFTAENGWGSSYPRNFVKVGGELYFTATDKNSSRYGLYRANEDNVTRILDGIAKLYATLNDELYVFDEVGDSVEIRKLNTTSNTLELVESFSDYSLGEFVGEEKPVMLGTKLIFAMKSRSNPQGLELWVKDGNNSAKRLSTTYMLHYYERSPVKIGNFVYAVVDEIGLGTGKRLLRTDGTVAGTELIETFDGVIDGLTPLGDALYFILDVEDEDYKSYYELWKYDTTNGNANIVKRIIEHTTPTVNMNRMYAYKDKIIFRTSSTHDDTTKLWVSDGTSDGTYPIAEVSYNEHFKKMFELGGKNYFQDSDYNLYKTDFTKDGTSIVVEATCDITPDPFSFTDKVDVELNTEFIQEINVSGINYPETKVSITGGEYSLDGGLTWRSDEGVVANGATIKVKHVSANEYSTTTNVKLYVGDRYAIWNITTKPPVLQTPNQFTFTDVTNVDINTEVVSNEVTITGINVPVDLTISGGYYSIDNGQWSNTPTTVVNNQVIRVKHTSSASYGDTINTTLTVGGVSDTFSSTTRPAPNNNATIVVIGDLMWEDTPHTRDPDAKLNWNDAYDYCANLVLEGYDDWRLPHSDVLDDGVGTSELQTIRVEANNPGDNAIHESFVPVYVPDENSNPLATWSDWESPDGDSHGAMFFFGSVDNEDTMPDTAELNVRCVRDIK